MANASGGIESILTTGKGDSPRIKLRDWLMGGNNPGGKSRSGLSFKQEQADDLITYTGVGPLLTIYNGVARGADFAVTAVQDLASFAANPGEKTRDELGQLGGRLKSIWNNLNPIDRLDFNLGDESSAPDSLDFDRIIPGESVEQRAKRQSDILIARDDARVAAGDNAKGIAGIDKEPTINPETKKKWTKEEIDAKEKERVIEAANNELDSRPGYIGDNSVMSQFDVGGDTRGKTNLPDGKLSARESETMRGGGIFPNMGANRQEYGGGNYGPSSGFDTMSNYFWPMALNDAAKRGEDISTSEGIKAVFDETFPGGDYNRFKYSSGPGALAFFGQDSLGIDGKPLKSSPNASVTDAEGNIVDSIDWYTYDPITGEGLFTEAGLEKFKAANPGVTPPVGVKKTNAGRKEGEPNLPENGENEEDDGLNPDGSRNLPPIPRPNKDGNCPAGYNGIDTNGDGFIDTCVPEQSQIPGAVDTKDQGMAGRTRDNPSTNLQEAAGVAALDIYNDPTNFMRFQPSALQMTDPRYFGIKSFVPRGEQQDFNFGYKTIPGQQYVNYPQAKKSANGGLMSLAGGGSTSYPRMNGQIAGPGTEKSDDIPAMLSDGEFVVNAAAVRGIGNLMGRKKPKSKMDERREGARTMYALQQAGEKAARMS